MPASMRKRRSAPRLGRSSRSTGPTASPQLGVDAVLAFAKDGTKPMPHYTDTGVNLISDKAEMGVTSKDTTYGLANCWDR
jgi:hypothetical protein